MDTAIYLTTKSSREKEDRLILLNHEQSGHFGHTTDTIPGKGPTILIRRNLKLALVFLIVTVSIIVATILTLVAVTNFSNTSHDSTIETKMQIASGSSTNYSTSSPSPQTEIPSESSTNNSTSSPSPHNDSHETQQTQTSTSPASLLITSTPIIITKSKNDSTTDGDIVNVAVEKTCTSEFCKEAASEMKSFMNESYDPCTHFFQYSCGGWMSNHKLPKGLKTLSVLGQMTLDNAKTIQTILENYEEEEQVDPGTIIIEYLPKSKQKRSLAGNKAHNFFISCLNKDSDKSVKFPWDGNNFSTNQQGDKSLDCAKETHKFFPDVIHRLFVLEKLPEDKHEAVLKMYEEIFQTYTSMVKNISWLDAENQERVLNQFATLTVWNGYSSALMDVDKIDRRYEYVEIANDTYSRNVFRLEVYIVEEDIMDQINEVTLANAFFVSRGNTVRFPAGIDQRPFFDLFYPMIINYARLGYTMGHELTHAFQYYCEGLKDNKEGYHARRSCIEKLYNNFRINHKFFIEGNTTVEENFSDVGGLQVAYEAYKNNHWENFEKLPGFENFTQSQVFFIAAAQADCRIVAPGQDGNIEIQRQIITNPHSPNSVRVVGEMTNNKDFAEAFNCPLGTLYNLQEKCEIFN